MNNTSNLPKVLVCFLFCCLSVISSEMLAQDYGDFTQLAYNTSVFNPGFLPKENSKYVFGSYQNQFVGLQGAPKLVVLSGASSLGYTGLGIGAHLEQESIGIMNRSGVSVDLSYLVTLKPGYELRLGIKTSLVHFKLDYNRLTMWDTSDPYWELDKVKKISPNIGIGAVVDFKDGLVGISIPNLIQDKIISDKILSINQQKARVYLHGQYNILINPSLILQPMALFKITPHQGFHAQVASIAHFNEMLEIGLSYQWGASFSFLAGYHLSNALFIGYNYAHLTNDLQQYSQGSHQFFVRFGFFNTTSR